MNEREFAQLKTFARIILRSTERFETLRKEFAIPTLEPALDVLVETVKVLLMEAPDPLAKAQSLLTFQLCSNPINENKVAVLRALEWALDRGEPPTK